MSEHYYRGIAYQNDGSIKPDGNIWFSGIAINEYEEFSNLHNAILDVKTIEGVLKENYFPTMKCNTIVNGGFESIVSHLDWLRQNIKPSDTLIIYFAGHGYKDQSSQRGFWIPKDAKRDNRGLYIHNRVIIEYIEDIKSFHTLLIVDSCFAGAITNLRQIDIHDVLEGRRSRWVITSGHSDEKVDDGKPGGNSPFANALKYCLETIDLPSFNLSELGNRVVQKAKELNPKQTAYYGELNVDGHDKGQIVFIKRSAEQALYNYCKDNPNRLKCKEYLDSYPEGQYLLEIYEILNKMTEREESKFQKCKIRQDFFDFMTAYPDSPLRNKANKKFLGFVGIGDMRFNKRRKKHTFIEPELLLVERFLNEKREPNNFYIGKCPVTREEFSCFWKSKRKKMPPSGFKDKNLPMVNITWQDAIEYVEWLSELTDKQYRLPYENEWEFAAMGGIHSKGFKYAGSNIFSEVANFKDSVGSLKRILPVEYGRKPNELGIFDMSGNVWEWCRDYLSDDLCAVIRGGSYMSAGDRTAIATRNYQSITESTDDIGFRLVMTVNKNNVQ